MIFQTEYFYDALPNRLTLECLFDWHAFNMGRLSAVQRRGRPDKTEKINQIKTHGEDYESRYHCND